MMEWLPDNAEGWFDFLVLISVPMCLFVFVSLFFFPAAYGRHNDGGKIWGPDINPRLGWFLMEVMSCVGFAVIYFMGDNAWQPMPLIFLLMWQFHYFHRTFIFPMTVKVRPGSSTPIGIPLMAIGTNGVISFLNASALSWVTVSRGYDLSWLADPRFIIGALIFASGYYVNKKADAMLAALRKPGETGYKIPRGWLYEKISCPNYFGEVLTWVGWSIAIWSVAGWVFVMLTLANLLPRAISNHKWYHEKFADYPKNRKIIIPYIL
ncbi:MAG: 3-oxo-5-alpha-steroid 4-dehydrogenase [Nevskiales bacterium]